MEAGGSKLNESLALDRGESQMEIGCLGIDGDSNLIDGSDDPIRLLEFVGTVRGGNGEHLASCGFTSPNSCRRILDHQALPWLAREDSGASEIALRMRLPHRDGVASDRVPGCRHPGLSKPAAHHLLGCGRDNRPSIRRDRCQQFDCTWVGDDTELLLVRERIELRKMVGHRFRSELRKILPDGVDSTPAVRSTQVKRLGETVMGDPARPASLIAMGGPYEYAVHIEQHASDGNLDLDRGMDLSCTRVHKARLPACTSLLRLIVRPELCLLSRHTLPV